MTGRIVAVYGNMVIAETTGDVELTVDELDRAWTRGATEVMT